MVFWSYVFCVFVHQWVFGSFLICFSFCPFCSFLLFGGRAVGMFGLLELLLLWLCFLICGKLCYFFWWIYMILMVMGCRLFVCDSWILCRGCKSSFLWCWWFLSFLPGGFRFFWLVCISFVVFGCVWRWWWWTIVSFFMSPSFLPRAPGSSLLWRWGVSFFSFLIFVPSSLGGGVWILVSSLWCGLGSSWWSLFVCFGWMVTVLFFFFWCWIFLRLFRQVCWYVLLV